MLYIYNIYMIYMYVTYINIGYIYMCYTYMLHTYISYSCEHSLHAGTLLLERVSRRRHTREKLPYNIHTLYATQFDQTFFCCFNVGSYFQRCCFLLSQYRAMHSWAFQQAFIVTNWLDVIASSDLSYLAVSTT